MKKHIFSIGVMVALLAGRCVFGAVNCCSTCFVTTDQTLVYDSSCTSSTICSCSDTTTTANNLITTIKKTFSSTCTESSDGKTVTAAASCRRGVATYACVQGYYATYPDGTLGMPTCVACPDGGTTAGTGAVSQTECYIPSGTSCSDDTGDCAYTDDCYYTE